MNFQKAKNNIEISVCIFFISLNLFKDIISMLKQENYLIYKHIAFFLKRVLSTLAKLWGGFCSCCKVLGDFLPCKHEGVFAPPSVLSGGISFYTPGASRHLKFILKGESFRVLWCEMTRYDRNVIQSLFSFSSQGNN